MAMKKTLVNAMSHKTAAFSRSPARAGLRLGAANTALEREADRVARALGEPLASATTFSAGVRAGHGGAVQEGDAGEVPASVTRTLSSPGQPLPAELRSQMERRFQHDFSRVRIHSDSTAAESARDIRAKAYTAREHIVFGARKFAPETHDGCRLLAHELTHVVQQPKNSMYLQRDLEDWQRVQENLENIRQSAAARHAMRQPRKLNPIELEAAKFVFEGALDTSGIVISEGGIMTAGGYARTVNDRIYFPDNTFYQPGFLKYLIHELTHVWQYQRGAEIPGMIWEALVARYDYGGQDGLRKALDRGKAFDDFTTEQQGSILADYYEWVVDGRDTEAFEIYVDDVRNGNEKRRRFRTVEPLPRSTLDVAKHNAEYRARTEADMIRQLKVPMGPNDDRAPARARRIIEQFSRMTYWSIDYRERFAARRKSDELVNLLFSRLSETTINHIFRVLGIKREKGARP
ncbi:MAG TPA: DUF4157 domain-containing protein [Steroidobacteraceae bacterium]|nr:DUF4157 domain-containing protein [Steroidobacteraceae bacterium]